MMLRLDAIIVHEADMLHIANLHDFWRDNVY